MTTVAAYERDRIMPATQLTTGDLAQLLGVPDWQIRRMDRRGLLPTPRRLCGRYRVWSRRQLPAIRRAVQAAGGQVA
jgi:DNA-binding transcriptional MerR regulator